jgi:sn-glycerol 3-phosphate transport system ATP-binding protein
MPKNSLVLRSVGKTYGKNITAVEKIDAEITDGEFVVIVGPSGCGKSTLLRMVAGLETVTSGDILIGDTRVNDLEPAQRDVAMVFQNYALYPHMSVYDNMAYALKIRGLTKDEIKKQVAEVAKILELEPLLQRRPKALSGGQRQRVAMGRCIIRNPKLFLFDEPLSNLDTKLRHQMRLELKKLHHRLKTTSLYVTHDQVEAMTLGDRLIVMNQGRAEQIGTPIDIYQKPATKFVAGFIGSPGMNFIQATITNSGKTANCPGLGQIKLPDAGLVNYIDKKVTIGIRPEHIVVETATQSDLSLPVVLVETLGADSLIHCETEEPPQAAITIRLPGTHQLIFGEQLSFSFPQEKLHLFNKETGATLQPDC